MRPLSKIFLSVTLFLLPVSAQAEGAKESKAPAAKHTKRKTASKTPKGAIGVEKLKQEVASRIAQEKKQAERALGKSGAPKAMEGAVAQVKARLGKVIQDGVVTGNELQSVRDSYRLMAVKAAKKPAKKAEKSAKAPAKAAPAKAAPAKAAKEADSDGEE